MLLCRVVIGRYIEGKPNLDRNDALSIDSFVDSLTNPTTYVTLTDHQAYPLFLIQFRQRFQYLKQLNSLLCFVLQKKFFIFKMLLFCVCFSVYLKLSNRRFNVFRLK